MNKDALLATIIGFGVGLVIAGLVFLSPTLFRALPHFSLPKISWSFLNPSKSKVTPTPKPKSNTLTIESPLSDSIEPKNETLLSGTTAPNAIVVLEGEIGETVAVANAQGAYAGKLTLGEGKNVLKVTSYAGKDVQTQSVIVYFTTENF